MTTSLAAQKRFPGNADKREGFDAGIRHALNFLLEQQRDYGYYSTIDFDSGYIHALELTHELLELDLEPGDDELVWAVVAPNGQVFDQRSKGDALSLAYATGMRVVRADGDGGEYLPYNPEETK